MFPIVVRNKSTPWIKNKTPRNNHVGWLGDSLSCCSEWETFSNSINVASYNFWTIALPKTGESSSQGLFLPGGTYALTGCALDYIKDTLLPNFLTLNPRPGFCAVLGGTNDVGTFGTENGVHAAQTKLRTIYQTLMSNKIVPIAQGIPTISGNATYRSYIPNFNQHVSDLATELGIPYIDYYPVTDNGSDGWITGYSSDNNVHWGTLGAIVAGQALKDMLMTSYGSLFSAPNLVTAGNDSGDGILYENGTMLDDGDSNGVPDGGYAGHQVSNFYAVITGGADTQFSFVTENGVVSGKWWRINKVANTAELYLLSQQYPYIDFTVGKLYDIGYIVKILNPQEAAYIEITMYDPNDSAIIFYQHWSNLQGIVAPFKINYRFIPSKNISIRIMIKINSGTVDFYLGQLTIREVG